MLNHLKAIMRIVIRILLCHRAIYTGLAASHGSACWLTGHPEVYAPMAALYAILALRG